MDRQWALLLAGIVVFSLGDGVWLWLEATGGAAPTSALDLVWPLAFVLLAAAAWQRRRAVPTEPSRRALLAGPIGFGLLATGLLVHGALSGLEPVPAALAGATLVGVLLRLALSFAENVALLERAHAQSVTDQLTGLRNRRCLFADLERTLSQEGRPAALGLFDLNGFKGYNDAFGHLVGDLLLARLSRALAAAVDGHGHAYRLGGDEFCVLVDAEALPLAACGEALSEAGDGYAITASAGLVLLPDEAQDAATALGLADGRMYADKRGRALAAHA